MFQAASLKDYLIKLPRASIRKARGELVAQLKFSYGKKQKVDDIELDKLFTDLQGVLQKHPIVPAANIDALVSEWINDLLFVAGKITEEELQEAMQAFESQGVEATNEPKEEESQDEDDEE